MKRKINWGCFYSQTGQEIMNISNVVGIVPKVVITNNWEKTAEPVRKWILDKHITPNKRLC